MKRLLFAAALAAAASAPVKTAPAADPPAKVKGDLARLQGTWAGKAGPGDGVPMTYTFRGNAVTIRISLGGASAREITLKGEVRLDESAKPEKSIDWLNLTDTTGKTLPEQPGIYAFDGDDLLKLRSAGRDKTRPTEFTPSSSGAGGTLLLTRVAERPGSDKEKDKDKAKTDGGDAKEAPPACEEIQDKDKAEVKGDLARLQGTWTAKVGPDKDIPVTLAVKGPKVTVTFTTREGEERSLKGEVVLNDSAKPKTIDWVKFALPNGDDAPDNLGIYTLDGDEFTVCTGGPGNDRPTEFKAGDGGPPQLVVFTRKK